LGTVLDTGAIGGRQTTYTGNLSKVGDVDWYKITAVDNPDTGQCTDAGGGKTGETFDLRIDITPHNDEFWIDVFKGGCTAGDEICSNQNTPDVEDNVVFTYDFSFAFSGTTDPEGGLCSCINSSTPGLGNRNCGDFNAATWGSPGGAYYIKVERALPTATCGSYTLTVSNSIDYQAP
jgi:hypothetical protein